MKRVSYFFVSLTLCMLSIFTFAFNGVSAKWFYGATGPIQSISIQYKLEDFYWEGSGLLPDNEANQYGENHIALLQKIIDDISYGLNTTEKPILHNYLEQVGDIVYCEQQVEGGNLKHLMLDGTGAYALLFQVEYISATEYHVYTYSQEDATDNTIGTRIEVYQTIVAQTNGKWDGVKTRIGSATVTDPYVKKVPRAISSVTWLEKTT